MKFRHLLTISLLALVLIACSDSKNKQQTSENAKPATTNQAPTQTGQPQLSPTQQAAIAAARNLPKQGKVLELMHAAGYTYMQVETGTGKPMWIAASMMRVKPDQQVKWTDAAVMNNFNSKTLHRTFDQILFVSNAQVIE